MSTEHRSDHTDTLSSYDSNVLFVCMGNICRSPAGEGIMKKTIANQGLDRIIGVDSAGTTSYHIGSLPDPRMISAAKKRGYLLTSRARRFDTADFDRFDLIIAMDRDNLSDIRAQDIKTQFHEKTRLLSSFLSETSPNDVPDPYFGGDAGFETVLDMIEGACPAILEMLRRLGPRGIQGG